MPTPVFLLALAAAAAPKASLEPHGGFVLRYAGVPVLAGDSLLLMDEKWKAIDRAKQGKLTLTRRGDAVVAVRRSALITLTKTVVNRPDGVTARWDYRIQPDPRGRHVELCVRVVPGVLDDLKPNGKTNGFMTFRGRLALSSFLGRFAFDASGSSEPWSLDDLRRVSWAKMLRLRVAPAYDPAKGCSGSAVLRVRAEPSRSPAFLRLAVAAAGNRGLRDDVENDGQGGWTDQGSNDLRAFRPGAHAFLGVPFHVGERAIILRGEERPAFPKASPPIPVNAKVERLYFLHTAAWKAKQREPVARYRIRYADGRTLDIPVRYGVDIADWWSGQPPLNARAVWTGDNGRARVSLFLMRWLNPRPKETVESLTVESADSGAVPILLAAAAVKTGALRAAQLALLDEAFEKASPPRVSTRDWFPAAIAWKDGIEPNSALDVSFLNHAPAGKFGFVQARAGHFVFEKRADEPVRFWGTNAALHGPFPPKSDAPGIARAWARQGVNLVRMHLYAVYEDTMIAADGSLNPAALDRFDFFVAQLKQAGIYIYMDLNDGMFYDRLLGKKIPVSLKKLKMASLFDPELIDAQKRLARMLFKHVNPYTGLALVDEPAVAMYEITNENSLTSTWGALKARLPEPYYSELEALWRAWRKRRGLPPKPLGMNLGGGSPEARRFAAELQKRYLDDMYDFLRGLGVKAPICGTNITFTLGDLWASRRMDFTNDHAYWDHPNVRARPMTFGDRPAARAAVWSLPMIPRFARAKVRGKPLVAGEWNFCFPNNYRCEGLPLMAAYAAFQGWDALLFYCATGSFNGGRWSWFEKTPGILVHTQQTDPATWGLSQTAALLFRRGDVRPAARAVTLAYDDARVWADRSALGQAPFLPALVRVETALAAPRPGDWLAARPPAARAEDLYLDAAARLGVKGCTKTRVVSDTGEIARDAALGVLTVNAPRAQIAAGFLAALDEVKLSDLTVRCETRFATIALVSLDGRPLRASRRMLLTAVANARNRDTRVEGGRLLDMGRGPVIAEPVTATVSLRGAPFTAYALDTLTGRRKRRAASAAASLRVNGEFQTIYYELVR